MDNSTLSGMCIATLAIMLILTILFIRLREKDQENQEKKEKDMEKKEKEFGEIQNAIVHVLEHFQTVGSAKLLDTYLVKFNQRREMFDKEWSFIKKLEEAKDRINKKEEEDKNRSSI